MNQALAVLKAKFQSVNHCDSHALLGQIMLAFSVKGDSALREASVKEKVNPRV